MERNERVDGRNTREAILAAAAAEFAEKGFEGASTRAICQRAGVNNALANRYFGTKENLYGQVAQRLFGELGAPLAKLAEGVKDARTWRRAVRTWVEDFLYMTLPTQEPQILCASLFREEVTHPTKFHEAFKRAFGKPVYDALRSLLAMAIDDADQLELWTTAVWAQVSVYALADPVWHDSFRPSDARPSEWAEKVCGHICENLFARVKFHQTSKVGAEARGRGGRRK